jgi:exonuclease VII small subunit
MQIRSLGGGNMAGQNDRSNSLKGPAECTALAEHIRTVHFTLLVLCIALPAAISTEKPRSFERARRDLAAIVNLLDDLPRVMKAVKADVQQRAEQRIQGKGRALQMGRPIVIRIRVGKEFQCWEFSLRSITLVIPPNSGEPGIPISDDLAVKRGPVTMQAFAQFWTHHRQSRIRLIEEVVADDITISVPEPPLAIEQDEGAVRRRFGLRVLTPTEGTSGPGRVSARSECHTTIEKKAHLSADGPVGRDPLYSYTNPDPLLDLDIHLNTIPVDLTLQDVIRDNAHKRDEWISGSFEDTFKELSEVVKDLPSTEVRELLHEIDKREKEVQSRGGDHVEIFGAKLPTSQIGNWGSAILLAVQFYLWAYISSLRTLVRSSGYFPNGAWIGLHDNCVVRVFVSVSVLVFPPGVLVFVDLRSWAEDVLWVQSARVVVFTLSTLLAVVTALTVFRLWRQLGPSTVNT